jgi:WD40 repeat protein
MFSQSNKAPTPIWRVALLCFSLGTSFGGSNPSADAMRLLQRNCLGCHNPEKHKGGLNLTTREAALKGGDDGEILTPKNPAKSKLISVLAAESDPHMPPKKQLKPAEIDLLKKWIASGAAWDQQALAKAAAPREVKLGPIPSSIHPVYAIAVTSDGSRLAIGRAANIETFDLTSTNTAPIAAWTAHGEFVRALAWSADGKRLASGSFREVALWEDGKAVWKTALTDSDRVTAVRFINDSELAVAEGKIANSGRISILDAATGKTKTSWAAHADLINDLSVSADGKLLASAGADHLAKIWDVATGKELHHFEGHSQAVYGVAFNSDGTQLLTVGADKTLFVWDVKTRESVVTMHDRKTPLTSVVWPKDGKAAFVTDEGGTLWSFSDFKAHTGAQSSEAAHERSLKTWDDELHIVSANADGKRICVADDSGIVRVLDEHAKELRSFEAKVGPAVLSGPLAHNALAKYSSAPNVKPTSEPPRGLGVRHAIAALDSSPASKRASEKPETASTTTTSTNISFVRDVLPMMAKAGCMAGSCHAKPEGQNGFKLSVFSYDPKSDYREIVKESRGRRIFPAAPEESLLLLKPTATIDHGGGERFPVGSETYQMLVRWIRAGMPYQTPNEPTLVGITVEPNERAYKKKTTTPLVVTAKYSDGSSRDVTRLADFIANDKEIATVAEDGVIQTGNLNGETVIVARYMGQVAASRVTIPTDHKLPHEKYAALPANNFIDTLAYKRFENLGVFPSDLCSDSEFLRRSTLDAIGRLPTLNETRAFFADRLPLKRERWIEKTLADPAYADYWANKWADLLRPNPDRVGVKSIFVLDQWLRESFRENKPYDQFVREILTAEGSNHRDGPAVIYRDRREPPDRTTLFSQLFLGTRMECAKCHHHPNERWSQDDFYQFAAFFGPLKEKGAGLSPPISAGTEEFFFQPGAGEVKHPVTGAKMSPRPPDASNFKVADNEDPRIELADWLTNPKNPFFARAAVNRIWSVFFGRGFVEPVDDFRVSNPIVNEPLLQALADDFVAHGYDLKKLMRTIMQSRLYQLSSEPNEFNLTDTKNFSRSYRRRLSAEVLLDAVNDVTGATDQFNGSPPDTRAIQTWSYKVNSQFMDAFSRPNPSTDCPCERDAKTSVVQSLHMMNSRTLQDKLDRTDGRVGKLVDSKLSPEEIVGELYLAAFCRAPTVQELTIARAAYDAKGTTRRAATEDVLWALLNSPEFVFNH